MSVLLLDADTMWKWAVFLTRRFKRTCYFHHQSWEAVRSSEASETQPTPTNASTQKQDQRIKMVKQKMFLLERQPQECFIPKIRQIGVQNRHNSVLAREGFQPVPSQVASHLGHHRLMR
jgi:hypothetical protein